MDGDKRRKAIIDKLRTAEQPVSGTALGKMFQVSRQVIVQDIALIRTYCPEIVSTHRGYILHGKDKVERIFKVCHTNDRIQEELNLIVDAGGYVKDVFVKHPVYGTIKGDLNLSSRRDVRHFLEKSVDSRPLTEVTNGIHYHTVEAESQQILDEIEEALQYAGILVKKEPS